MHIIDFLNYETFTTLILLPTNHPLYTLNLIVNLITLFGVIVFLSNTLFSTPKRNPPTFLLILTVIYVGLLLGVNNFVMVIIYASLLHLIKYFLYKISATTFANPTLTNFVEVVLMSITVLAIIIQVTKLILKLTGAIF